MDKILTKKLQTQISSYFSSISTMTLPERRSFKDVVTGILKSKSVLVNQIASSLRESIRLKDVCKRFSAQYLKDDYADNVLEAHLEQSCKGLNDDVFIMMDGTDIIKKCATCMEGLDWVKDGNTPQIGLGYKIQNINAVSSLEEITPLYSKPYSFNAGALSSNNEIKKGFETVNAHLEGKGCWVYDRESDNQILKDFFFEKSSKCILRLKRSSILTYKGKELKASQIANRVSFSVEQTVARVKKNKKVFRSYELCAVPVTYRGKRKEHNLWLVISRNKSHGGLCYLLVKSPINNAIEVALWAFKGYKLRWKIEEYHRHIKQQYGLEAIQIKTFNGIKSMLALLTVAMFLIYKKIRSIHFSLMLDSGYNLLNKNSIYELTNFIYYKIGSIVSTLLMPVRIKYKKQNSPPTNHHGQLILNFK